MGVWGSSGSEHTLCNTPWSVITCHVYISLQQIIIKKVPYKKNEVLISKSFKANPSVMGKTLQDYTVSSEGIRFCVIFKEVYVQKEGV
jgi:hypothetical protein